MKKVSVIIPTYNRENFICDAIDSVLAQEYKNLEIIIVDDGSNDNTEKVVKNKYGEKIIYLKQRNMGPSRARNEGLKVSKGEYIAFLDSDDLWLNNKLIRQIEYLENNPQYGAICGNIVNHDIIKNVKTLRKNPRYARSGNIWRKIYSNPWDYHFMNLDTILFRKSILKSVELFDETIKICEDWHFTFRIAIIAKIKTHGEPVAIARIHDDQLSLNIDDKFKGGRLAHKYWEGERDEAFIILARKLMEENFSRNYIAKIYLNFGIGRALCKSSIRSFKERKWASFIKQFFCGLAYNPKAFLEIIISRIFEKFKLYNVISEGNHP